MSMFNFLNKLKSHKSVEDKYDRILQKGFAKEDVPDDKYTTEFGEYYDKNGSIRIDGFMNEATNYMTSNIYDMEHKQAIEKYRYMSTLPEIVDEFFVVKKPNYSSHYYNTNSVMFNIPKSSTASDAFTSKKVPMELITYVDSGLYHPNKTYPYSNLHKALKVSNQLTLLEDALLIYRITRAPERRIFFIEVGNMPPDKSEEYIRKLMRQYRQEKVYDVNTGTINEKGAFMAMTEDFWLPRRNGQSTTEVSTLQAGQNLSEVEDLNYFANKIWRALKVPYTRRADKENNGVQFNSGRELTIEELKFFKFILKLRREFSRIFDDLLTTQLIVKRIINADEIDAVMSKIKYMFHNDNFFSQFLKLDILSQRLDVLNNMDNFVGKYFPIDYIYREIFELSDPDILALKRKLEEEKESGELDDDSDDSGSSMPPPPQ